MPIFSIRDLRASAPAELRDASDEALIKGYATSVGMDPTQVANTLGYDAGNGGLASKRTSASVDNYQSNLYGLGGAAARAAGLDGVAKFMDAGRDDNQFQADVASSRAQALGGVDDWRNVNGVGSGLNYLGGLAVQSAPYLAESMVGGIAARGLMTGTKAALRGAETVEAATSARKALNAGSMAGAVGASYPSAVGDILSNQRDENGTENLGSAALGGVLYAGANAVGAEGLLARGLRPMNLLEGGTLSRIGKAAGTTALTEGASETGQEMVNQGFGRMAVNPNQTMFNPDANKRYVDSFVGGALLGGTMGGVGGLRRSEDAAPVPLEEGKPRDLLQIGLDTNVRSPNEMVTYPDGTTMLRAEYDATMRERPDGTPMGRPPEPMGSFTPEAENNITTEMRPLQPRIDEAFGIGQPGYAGKGYAAQFEAAAAEPTGNMLGRADAGQVETANTAIEEAQRRAGILEQEQQQAQAIRQAQQEQTAKLARINTALGVDSAKVTQSHTLFQELESMRDAGTITPAQFTDNAAKLAGAKPIDAPGVRKFIRDTVKNQEVAARPASQPSAQEIAQAADTPAPVDPLAAAKARLLAPTANTAAAPAPSTDVAVNAPKPPAVMSTPKADVGAMADALVAKLGLDPNKTMPIGRNGRAKQMTAREFAIKLLTNPEDAGTPAKVKIAEMDRTTVLAAMGRDAEGDMVANPLTLDQVAMLRSRLEGGKPVTREGIRLTLAKFNIDEDMINTMVGGELAPSINEAELSEGAETANDRNYRVGRSLTDVTSNALIDNRDTPKQKALSAEAAKLTKEDKLALDNAAVDEYLAPPKLEAPEVAANRLATAEQTKIAPPPRMAVANGEMTESEADAEWIAQRGVEKEIQALQAAWNQNLDEGDVAFEDMPARLQLEVYKLDKDVNEGTITHRQRLELHYDIQEEANENRTDVPGLQGPNAQAQIAGPSEVQSGEGTDTGATPSVADAAPGRRETATLSGKPQDDATDVVDKTAPKGREVTAEELELIKWKSTDLPMPQSRKLEAAYNAETGTADFNQQLKADVEAFLEGGLEAVNPKIASIIKDMAPEVASVPGNNAAFSKANPTDGSDAASVLTEIKSFLRLGALGNKVTVVQTVADLPAGIQRSVNPTADTQGFVVNGKAYLVAGNIAPGKAKSVFLHEVGAHLGLENLLGKPNYTALVAKVNQWAAKNDGSQESKLAQAAQQRVTDAGTDSTQADSELVAYFIEEAVDAGIDPTATQANTEFGRWFRTLWAAFKKAMHTLGVNPDKLTAQNVVDMAYGAARLELATEVEIGAGSGATPETVLRFYRQTERSGKELQDGAGIDGNVTSYTGPGTERVSWGTDSKIGGFGPIRSIASYQQQPGVHGDVRSSGSGSPATEAGSMGVYFFSPESEDLAKKHGEKSSFFFLHVSVYRDTKTGPWSVLLNTPPVTGNVFAELKAQGLVEEALDPSTGKPTGYGRVTNVTDAQRNELLAEARRRLTRVMRGEVPSLKWVRTTGRHINTRSEMSPDRVKAKFSKAAPLKSGNKAIDAMPGVVSDFFSAIGEKLDWVAVRSMFTEDLVNRATKIIPAASKYMANMKVIQTERTKVERDIDAVLEQFNALPAHERGTGPASVNGLLKDSTMAKAWAFQPTWDGAPKDVAVDPALAARFNSPAISDAGRALIRKVFEHGHSSLKTLQDTVMGNITTEYDGLIAELTKAGDTAEVAKQTKAKAKSLADYQSLLAIRSTWPYAPLRRFGKHVVMAMSQRYMDAKREGNNKLMQELQKDGDHYFVAFAATVREAKRMVGDLEASFPKAGVGHFEKLDQGDSMMGGRDMLGAMGRLRKMVRESTDSALGEKTGDRVDDLMRQLHLQLLSETSARKGEIHRKNIAGAADDMMRSFATQGRATAHFIASLKTNGAVEDTLQDMSKDVSGTMPGEGRNGKQMLYNEIMRRHSMNLEYNPTPGVDKALAVSSTYLLLSNPSYFLMNATQPWMMSHPLMAARYGYVKAANELTRAYKDLLPILKLGGISEADYAKLPADVRGAVEAVADMGAIEISLGQDLGSFESNSDARMDKVAFALGKIRGAAQGVEAINRLSTAMAAYRLAKADGASEEKSRAYAYKVITETHGDYSGFNAPRFMRTGVGRIVTQFRKFQLIQLSMFAKLLHTAFKDAKPEERLVARKALLFNMGHLAAIGGVSALPGFAAISWLVGKAIPDDDEPDDPRATLTRAVGKEWSDLLWGGASQAAGVPLGGRIGAGGMLSLLPYTELDASRKGYESMFTAAAGPLLGGIAPRMVDGLGMMASGDMWKGTEAMLPAGFANASKAMRFGVDGVTQRNGDVSLTSDEIGALDLAMQAIGLPTNTIQERSYLAGAKFKAESFYKDRTSELKRAYSEAYNAGSGTGDVIADWNALQATRVDLGFTRQPMSELLKAPQERQKREASVIGGVQSRKSSDGFLTQLTQ